MLSELLSTLYNGRPSKLLYHYTSLQGLLSIVRCKSLWASDIRYVNDAQELQHFGALVNTAILTRLEGGSPHAIILQQLRNWLPSRLSDGPMLFAASFTESGNLLSQWRGYCPHGKGVSLAFDPVQLIEAGEHAAFQIGRCEYDIRRQEAVAEQVVSRAIEIAEAAGPSPAHHATQSFHHVFHDLEADLLRVAALMKSPAFKEENEWRLVSPVFSNYVEPPIRYREGATTLVPYLELPLPQGSRSIALQHVFVGPTPNPNLSISSVLKFLSREGIRPTRVSNSGVPYRLT